MAAKSKIEWTDASWSPIRARNKSTGKVGWHCEHVTPGCENCYAETMNARLGTGLKFKPGHREDVDIFLDDEMLLAPLRWKRPRSVFVCSMSDLFAAFVPDAWIYRVFAVMALAPQHTFQVLTKRSKRMREYMNGPGVSQRLKLFVAETFMDVIDRGPQPLQYQLIAKDDLGELAQWPLPNVWLGVSAEDQARADERIPDLLATSAATRFVSAEPLLGPITFHTVAGLRENCVIDALRGESWEWRAEGVRHDLRRGLHRLDWMIVGGESGPDARPMHPEWARSIRNQCASADVPFFFKQWGEFAPTSEIEGPGAHFHFPDGATVRRVGKKHAGRLLDGRTHDDLAGRIIVTGV